MSRDVRTEPAPKMHAGHGTAAQAFGACPYGLAPAVAARSPRDVDATTLRAVQAAWLRQERGLP